MSFYAEYIQFLEQCLSHNGCPIKLITSFLLKDLIPGSILSFSCIIIFFLLNYSHQPRNGPLFQSKKKNIFDTMSLSSHYTVLSYSFLQQNVLRVVRSCFFDFLISTVALIHFKKAFFPISLH